MMGLHSDLGVQPTVVVRSPLRTPRERPRFGLIVNPRSRGNVGLRTLPSYGVKGGAPTNHDELRSVLRELARRETNLLLVRGGDGTLREVLSALPEAYGSDPFPAIGLVKAGSTDLVAGEVGGCTDDDAVARLMRGAEEDALVRVRRPVLRVERAIDEYGVMRTVRGMLLGAGVFTHATQVGQRMLREEGTSHSAMVARTVSSLVRKLVFEGDPDGLMRGRPLALRDARAERLEGPAPDRFLTLVSGLRERLFLGRSPFFGEAADDELRHLTIDGPARHLARAFAALAIHRPQLAGPDWHSGASKSLVLETIDPFVIDGELFRAPPEGRVRIHADRPITFVSP